MVDIKTIKPNPDNPRLIKDDKFKLLVNSLKSFPQMMALRPIVIDENNIALGGNMRLKALQELKYKKIPDEWVKKTSELTEDQKREFIVKDNIPFGEWEWDSLANEWEQDKLIEWGLDIPNFNEPMAPEDAYRKLDEMFIVPPFSILDTKQGYWQDRKRLWNAAGLKSGETREDVMESLLSANKIQGNIMATESIFDPVLCEVIYAWFNVPDGKILDPFAGGSVRGIIAAKLNMEYIGIDLRENQVIANRINAKEVLKDKEKYPIWHVGDSIDINKIAEGYECDLFFSCPPYADLEKYSDLPNDLSNMDYDDFFNTYKQIISKGLKHLKNDRFAVFVVGDIRDKKGFYRNFVSDTIKCFWNEGVILYNEIILINNVGSLPVRVGKSFSIGRKVGKQHQNVLVFYKGQPKNIRYNFPAINIHEFEFETVDEQLTYAAS